MAYRFEGFQFDPDYGLSRAGNEIALEPRATQLLHYLLENRGRIVTRDELNEHLWDGRIVSDAALSTQVRAVRRALGDDRSTQKFVKTYPRRGFAFAAPVEIVPGRQGTDTGSRILGPGRPTWMWIAASVFVLAFLAAVGWWSSREETVTDAQPAHSLSIAVLPFDNLSGDASKNYLADAFTEDLITDLSRIRDAFVISRSTSFTYRDRETDAATVAGELGVRYILEGSLRLEGDTVRINAQLIDGRTNRHLWSDRYERTLVTLFDVQDSVTGRIASVLRAELRVAESRHQDPRATEAAWDYALRGNVILYNHQSVSDYKEAHALLSEAVSLDPTISSAWAGLAFIHYIASVAAIPGLSEPDSAALSLEAARMAVRADPMNAEPYWLVGVGHARLGEPERGMVACETAIDLNPNMDCGHVCAALVHMAKGEPEQAVPFLEYALELNPRFRPDTKEKYLGLAFIQSGRDDLAIEALNRALATAPEDMFANLALTAALALDGRLSEAQKALHDYLQSTGDEPPTLSSLRDAFGWMGPEVARMLRGLRGVGVPEA